MRASLPGGGRLTGEQRLRRLAALSGPWAWQSLLATVAVALLAGIVFPLSRTSVPVDPLLQTFDCAFPPCFPQTPASRFGDFLVTLPRIGYTLALLLTLPGLALAAIGPRNARAYRHGLLPFVATAAILVGTDVLPHVLNPCLAFGAGLPGLCGEFAGRWDVQERWHTSLHTLLGAVPLTIAYGLLGGRLGPFASRRSE